MRTFSWKQKSIFLLVALLGSSFVGGSCSKKKEQNSRKVVEPVDNENVDSFLWLEQVEGERALGWVDQENARSLDLLESDPRYEALYQEALSIFQDNDRIATPQIMGDRVYNFWRDAQHVQGIWRRSSLRNYLRGNPEWETVLDVDALSDSLEEENSTDENLSWVFKGSDCLAPSYERCLLRLSKGGTDASVYREFSLTESAFVETDMFFVPEAKSEIAWMDQDTLLIGTDWGEGSLTESGYPRIIKKWNRGTPLNEAQTLFSGERSDVYSTALTNSQLQIILRGMTFYTSRKYLLREDLTLLELQVPESSDVAELFKDKVILRLREDWSVGNKNFLSGSVVSLNKENILSGNYEEGLHLIFQAQENESFQSIALSKNRILINYLSDVTGKIDSVRWRRGSWSRKSLAIPENGRVDIVSASATNNALFFSFENFLQPETLYYLKNQGNAEAQQTASLREYFDSSDLVVRQEFADSSDGTRIPYFIVHKEGIELNGSNPTWLNAYGGFEISRRPFYDGLYGRAWLEKGGVYVLANIRGGGEYGPRWHQAALKENRQKAYDDFIAVSEKLISSGVTRPERLAISGGSNGGLLMGVAMTQRPDLYNAIACWVPLLDMIRYVELPPGASWIGEYGDPRIPEQREYIKAYSPYQNLNEDRQYPEIFFLTSTKDDRVHPGHARKMAAKMQSMGHNFYYFENREGGHGGSANLEQRAKMRTLQYIYFYQKVFPALSEN